MTARFFRLVAGVVLLLMSLWGVAYANEVKSDAQEFGLQVITPDRWKHRARTSPKSGFEINLEDVRSQANAYMNVAWAKIVPTPTAEQWAKELQMPGFMKSYVGSFQHEEREHTESKVTLPDGTIATVLHKHLLINGHNRSVAFAFWEREIAGEKAFFYTRVSNVGLFYKLAGSDVLNELLGSLRIAPK